MAQDYKYESIDTSRRDIRLLVVYPPSEPDTEDIVKCDFKRISLLDTPVPEYKTISYTWGDDSDRTAILVAGKPLRVPVNAEKAIRFFRLPVQDRLLWIDAACINQADDGESGEKGPHVQYMSLVYSKGAGNLVHLGDDHDGQAKSAFDTLRHLRNNSLSMLNDEHIPPNSDKCQALTSVLERPWFRRAWVVQEVVLGGRTECWLGDNMILVRAFQDCALHVGMAAKWQDMKFKIIDKFNEDVAIAIENLITLRYIREQREEYASGTKTEPDIPELIQQKRACKDPRDMVYSIVGIWNAEGTAEIPPELRVRYGRTPVSEVYRDATRYSIKHRKAPYILRQVAHRFEGDFPDNDFRLDYPGADEGVFPTWVPRWDRGLEDGAPSGLVVSFKCWPFRPVLVSNEDKCDDPDPNILRIDGVKIDKVTKVTEVLRSEDVRDPVALEAFISAAEKLEGTVVREKRAARTGKFIDVTEKVAKKAVPTVMENKKVMNKVISSAEKMAISALPEGNGSKKFVESVGKLAHEQLDKHSAELTTKAVQKGAETAKDKVPKAPTDDDAMGALAETLIAGMHNPHELAQPEDYAPYKTFRHHLTQAAKAQKESKGKVKKQLPGCMPVGEGRKAYYHRLVTVCQWRRFFVTKEGHIGLGPRCMKEGDVVVALRHGMWAFVLHPVKSTKKDEEKKYQFCGIAYLRGFMMKELVPEIQDGSRPIEQFAII